MKENRQHSSRLFSPFLSLGRAGRVVSATCLLAAALTVPSTVPAADLPGADEFNRPGGRYDVTKILGADFIGPLSLAGHIVEIDPVTGQVHVIDTVAPAGTSLTAGDREPGWDSLGTGLDGFIFAITPYNGALVAAGSFQSAGGDAASHIASWDGTSWTPLGAGTDGTILGLTVWNGNLIALGLFDNAGGVPASRIAAWDGANWSALGGGLTSTAAAVALSGASFNGDLVVSGQFDHAGATAAVNIASWDGVSWSPLGSGLNGLANVVIPFQGGLVAAGGFFFAGGVPVLNVASWDGTAWSDPGGGVDGRVWDAAVYGGELVVGGQFLNAGGAPAQRIASWNGNEWNVLGGGLPDVVLALAAYDTALVAGGSFVTAGGVPANYAATWDGAVWDSLGGGMNGPLFALAQWDTLLVAGGAFTQAAGGNAPFIASWRCELPVTPAGVSASTTLCDRINITWNDVPGDDGYEIRRDGLLIGATGRNATSFDDFTATPGTHDYVVTAVNACGASPAAAAVTGELHALPAKPATLAASDALCEKIRLDWSASLYATSYRIYRDGALLATVPAPAVSYEDMPPVGSYVYAVSAVSLCGWADSTFDTGTRLPGAPGKPAFLTASDTSCSLVRLDWPPVPDAEKFIVTRDGAYFGAALAIKHFFEVPSSPGDHVYGVVAENACGRSDTVTATGTVLPAPPGPPASLTVSDTSCAVVRLDWSAVAGSDSFRVLRNGVPVAVVGPAVHSYEDSPPPGTYLYAVAGRGVCGWSDTVAAAGARLGIPVPVGALTASDTSCSTIFLSWSASAAADSYRVERGGVPVVTVPAGVLSYEEALPSGDYDYAVTAFNHCDEATATVSGKVLVSAPGPVGQLTAPDTTCASVLLEWNASAGATEYHVYRDGAPIAVVTGLSYEETPAIGSHDYRVTAANSCGESAGFERTVYSGQTVSPVAALTASDTLCSMVRITWSVVAGASGYAVYRDGEPIATLGPTAQFFNDEGVNGVFEYHVATVGVCGEALSAAVTGRTAAAPAPPGSFTASDTSCAVVHLAWEGVVGAVEYTLYRDGDLLAEPAENETAYDDFPGEGDHSYAVAAVNRCGVSAVVEASGTMMPASPESPNRFSVIDTVCGGVILEWESASRADTFRLYRDGVFLAGLPSDSTRFETVETAGGHTYAIEAVNRCGISPGVEATAVIGDLPEPPLSLVASDTSCRVVALSWESASSPSPTDRYAIYRDGVFLASTPADQFTYEDPSSPGVHRYEVRAVNRCGESDGAEVNGRLLPGRPAAPAMIEASDASCTSVFLKWDAVAGADSFRLYRDGEAVVTVPASRSTWTDRWYSGSFRYAVAAGNACGWSDTAATAAQILPGTPAPPSALIASADDCDRVSLEWVHDTGEAAGFLLLRDADTLAELPSTERRFEDEPFTGGDHVYTVYALGTCGVSPGRERSVDVTGAHVPPPLLSPADGVSFSTGDPIRIEWAGRAGAAGYRAQVSSTRDFSTVIIDSTLSGDRRALVIPAGTIDAGGSAWWRIAAIDSCGSDRFARARRLLTAEPVGSLELSSRNIAFDHDPLNEIAGGEVPDPDPSAVVLRNGGNAPITWIARATDDWVAISPGSATLEPGDEDTLWASAVPEGLRGGEYTARIIIEAVGGSASDTIDVVLDVRSYRPGDVDGNGSIELIDLAALIEHLLEIAPVRAAVLRAGLADVNDDGAVDVSDVVALARLITREGSPSAAPSNSTSPVRLVLEGAAAPGAAELRLAGDVPMRAALIRFHGNGPFESWNATPASDAWNLVRKERENGDVMVLLYSIDRTPPLAVPGRGTAAVLLAWRDSEGVPVTFVEGTVVSSPSRIYALVDGGTVGGSASGATGFFLARALPTPFRGATTIEFGVVAPAPVSLAVYSPSGRRVRVLIDGAVGAGVHRIDWDGRDDSGHPVPPGLYLLRLDAPDGSRTRRTVLLR